VVVGPLELGRSLPETDWWIETTTRLAADSANEWQVVRQVFQSPLRPGEAIGALALLPLAFAPLGFGVLVRQTPAAGMAVGISATLCIAAYSSPAFAPVRHAWTASSSRFLLPAAMLGILLGGVWLTRSRKTAVLSAGVLAGFAVVNLGWQRVVGASAVTDIPILGATGVVAAMGGLAFLARRIRSVAVRLACVLAVVVTTVAGLGLLRGMLRNEFLRHEQVIHPMPRYWVEAVPLTDHPVIARKIAVTSGPHFALDNWFAYPFVGRALQNELIYVPISRDGRVHHFGSGQLAADLTATADYERWYERLVTLGVTDVMSFRPASLELEWMQGHPQHFEFVVGSRGDWGLFRVRDTRSVENAPPT
jgi:hypothetical protein